MRRKRPPLWLPRVGAVYDVSPGGRVLVLTVRWRPGSQADLDPHGVWTAQVLKGDRPMEWSLNRSDVLANWRILGGANADHEWV